MELVHVDDTVLSELSRGISLDAAKQLAREFLTHKLTHEEIEIIVNDNRGESENELIFKVIKKWIQKNGDVTRHQLNESLERGRSSGISISPLQHRPRTREEAVDMDQEIQPVAAAAGTGEVEPTVPLADIRQTGRMDGTIKVKILARTRDKTKGKSGVSYFYARITDGITARKLVAFRDETERIERLIKEGSVYDISSFQVKRSDEDFNPDPVEFILDGDSVLAEVIDTIGHIQVMYTGLADIKELAVGTPVAVRGRVAHVEKPFTVGDQKFWLVKAFLIDEHLDQTLVCLFEEHAHHAPNAGDVLYLYETLVKEYHKGFKSINTSPASQVKINPDEMPALLAEINIIDVPINAGMPIGNLASLSTTTNIICVQRCKVAAILNNDPTYVGCQKCLRKLEVFFDSLKCESCGLVSASTVYYKLGIRLSDDSRPDGLHMTSFTTTTNTLLGGRWSAKAFAQMDKPKQNKLCRKIEGMRITCLLQKDDELKLLDILQVFKK